MADSKIKIKLQSEADVSAFGRMKSEIASLGTKARTAMAALKSSFSSGVQSIKSFAASVGSNLMNIKAGFDLVKGAVQGFMNFIQTAINFETQTMQFKHFLGSIDEARRHMQMLKELGATPPFSRDEFAAASRELMVMSDGVLGFKGSLEMVGDAAAATGNPLERVAHAFGQAYAAIRDGAPISRAVAALRGMGIVTPEVVQKLKDLQDSGASSVEIWEELTRRIKQYGGAMNDQLDTCNGKLSAAEAKWDEFKRLISDKFAPAIEKATDKFGTLLDLLNKKIECGGLDTAVRLLDKAVDKASQLAGWLKEALGYKPAEAIEAKKYMDDFNAGWGDWEDWQKVDDFTQKRKRVNADGSEQFEYFTDEKAKAEAEAKKKAEEEAARVRQQLKEAQDRRDEEAQKQQMEDYKNDYLKFLEQQGDEDAAAARRRAEEAKAEELRKAKDEEALEKKLNEDMFKRLNDEADKRFEIEEKIAGKKKELDRAVAEADAKKRLEDDKKRRDKGMRADAKYHNGLFGQYRYDTDENGNLKKFRDWQRANRYAGRAERDEHRGDPDQRRFDKLVDRMQRGRKLSKKDQEFFDQYQDFLDQKNAQQNIDQNVQRIANDITQLKNQLAQMGVK